MTGNYNIYRVYASIYADMSRRKNFFQKLAGQSDYITITAMITMFTLSHLDMGQTWDKVGQGGHAVCHPLSLSLVNA